MAAIRMFCRPSGSALHQLNETAQPRKKHFWLILPVFLVRG
jgi:hypothetical protein